MMMKWLFLCVYIVFANYFRLSFLKCVVSFDNRVLRPLSLQMQALATGDIVMFVIFLFYPVF